MDISKIAQYNNAGALYMLNGCNYSQSIVLFRKAIRQTKQLLTQARANPAYASPELVLEFQDAGLPLARIGTDADLFISRSVVFIAQNNVMDVSVLKLYTISMISIYNLALAYHLSGLQDRDMKQLKRALSYYEIFYKLHVQQPLSTRRLVLSSVENVGSIFRLLRENEKSNMFFRHLLSDMSARKECGRVETNDQWNNYCSAIKDNVANALQY
eukprot:scaffold5392_cov107-Cylindrotheca_fusiformis.AAC.5